MDRDIYHSIPLLILHKEKGEGMRDPKRPRRTKYIPGAQEIVSRVKEIILEMAILEDSDPKKDLLKKEMKCINEKIT